MTTLIPDLTVTNNTKIEKFFQVDDNVRSMHGSGRVLAVIELQPCTEQSQCIYQCSKTTSLLC